MFFLLAAFMIVSIHKIKVKSLKVSLPTDVPVSQLEPKEDFVSVSINPQGQVQIDKDLITDPSTLLPKLQAIYARNKDQKFLISADKDSRNGDVIAVLAKLRTAGFQRVAFNLKGGGATPPAPAPSNATGSSAPPATPPVPSQPSVAPSVPVPLAPAVATPTELAAPSSSSAAPSPPPTPPKP